MSSELLKIEDLVVAFKNEDEPARETIPVVNGVSLTINRGECVALVGESGSGKSLTARSIVKLLPQGARVASGKIFLKGEDITHPTEEELVALRGKRVGIVFQDPLASLNPLMKIGKQIAEAIVIHHPELAKDKAELETRTLELMARVKLNCAKERLTAYPHELSGGERQRVVIAIALANDPELLIADEPTTALDANIQEGILKLILGLAKEKGIGVLLISHDLRLVRKAADIMHIMKQGRVVETLTTETRIPQHPYTKVLLRGSSGDYAIDESDPVWAKELRSGTLPTLLEVTDLSVTYKKKGQGFFSRTQTFEALSPISFNLYKGESLGIIGESGSGKTSLVMALLRLIESHGVINLCGERISEFNHRQMRPIRKKLQVVFQDPYSSLNPRMCVEDLILEGLRAHESEIKNIEVLSQHEKAVKTLKDVGLSESYLERFPHELSGGERQRVAIARALMLDPEILVLDEPTSALDRALQFQLMALLKRLQADKKLTTLYISHDLTLVKEFSHRVIVLKQGKCVEFGFTDEVFRKPRTAYLKNLLDTSIGETDHV